MSKEIIRVRAIIFNSEKTNVLLIHRIKDKKEYWVFPGGGIEEKESKEKALKRECLEELGVEIKIGELFATEIFNQQKEYFYFCEITGGKIGTGNGPEFQKDSGYIGTYKTEWISLEDFSIKNIQPENIKLRLKK